MIHKGFAFAYQSVSDEIIEKLSDLLKDSEPPIYLTGHSLGGALAALCSLDIVLSLGHTDNYVSTFGSPRCGSLFWRKIYDNMVPNHWRLALRSDIVTTLPRIGYHHVGKRVALTNTGEMFLDPNAIETMLWSSAGVGVTDHRTRAYHHAMEKFCVKYIPNYKPQFLKGDTEYQEESLFDTALLPEVVVENTSSN